MFMGSVLAEPKRGLSALKGGIQTGVDAGFKGAAKIGNGYNSLKGMKDTIQSADSIRDGLSDVGKFTMDSVKNKAANKMQQSGYTGYSSASPNRSNDFSRKFDKGKEGQSSNSDVNKRNNNEGSRTSQSNPFNDGTGMTMGMNGTSPLGSDLSAPSFDNIDFSDSSDFSYSSECHPIFLMEVLLVQTVQILILQTAVMGIVAVKVKLIQFTIRNWMQLNITASKMLKVCHVKSFKRNWKIEVTELKL